MDETLPAENPGNLQDYQSTYTGFDWSSFDNEFDWSRGGPYNLAAEAIDSGRAMAKLEALKEFTHRV